MNMKILFLSSIIFFCVITGFTQQKDEVFKLSNAVVVAQQDKSEDRYSLEINVLQLLADKGIKTMASLNLVKQGGSSAILATDSIQLKVKQAGIDTYMLISVRGYDKRFKPSEKLLSFSEELNVGHLFPLYREEVTSVTFTVTFYRKNEPVYCELIKTGNVGSREAVIKKLIKKLDKRLLKSWL